MKVSYKYIQFDSELEVDYCKYLEQKQIHGELLDFDYHPNQIHNLVGKRSYTPDFIVLYRDRIEIVECKGYNPYSKMIDDQIHNVMLSKNNDWLAEYVESVINSKPQRFSSKWDKVLETKNVIYKKIKYLKAYGFVDWDFKNPNTIANKRKEKINEQNVELKELRKFKKDTIRYFSLYNKSKLTANQKEFIAKYLNQFYKDSE